MLKHNTNTKGFTIVEILIVIAIFSIGILSVASIQLSVIKSNAAARRITEATALVENQLEQLQTVAFEDPELDPDGNPHVIVTSPYTLAWQVQHTDLDSDGENDSKTIDITVNWFYRGNREISLQHIIPKL